jgi:hypothetical protein
MDDRLHPQDWLLIIEALIQYGDNPRELDTDRQAYAWQLAERLAADHGLTTADAITQIDQDWPHTPHRQPTRL